MIFLVGGRGHNSDRFVCLHEIRDSRNTPRQELGLQDLNLKLKWPHLVTTSWTEQPQDLWVHLLFHYKLYPQEDIPFIIIIELKHYWFETAGQKVRLLNSFKE